MKEIIRDSEIYIYILELDQNKYYVGQTHKIEQRKLEHFNGDGSNFTKMYKPKKIIKTFRTRTRNNKKALLFETFITLLMMRHYGWQNVKGGKLLNLNQRKIENLPINKRIKEIKERIRTSELKY